MSDGHIRVKKKISHKYEIVNNMRLLKLDNVNEPLINTELITSCLRVFLHEVLI